MSTEPSPAGGPLTGVRVVELAGLGPGPFGAMVLADLGADVIRIDRPPAGNGSAPGNPRGEVMGRGKRSIVLDLKTSADLAVARELIDRADVVIDPFRPGVAERIGLAPDDCLERNPRLVYARMTGWGQDGPMASASGHDLNYIALVGALHPMGAADAPPSPPLNLVGDFGGGGMLLGLAVASALYEREQSGRGQVVDVAMVDGVATLLASICQIDALGEWSRDRASNWLDGAAPWYGSYRTADGRFVTIGSLEGKFYTLLLDRMGLDEAEWPQWDKGRWPALRARLEELFAQRTLDEWRAELEGSDVCFAPALRIDEAASHPHVAARGLYVERDGVLQPAPSPRFGRTPGAIRRPPPLPGEHGDEILAELGAVEHPPGGPATTS
jgi:alpha-methylacyl-CoA racemase